MLLVAFLRDRPLVLLVSQCLKTDVSYILSKIVLVSGGWGQV